MDEYNLDDKILFTPKILYMEYILLKYNDFLKNKLKNLNISQGEYTILFNIYYHSPLSQKELSEILYVSEAYVTKMIKKLERKGYVEREVDVNNKSRRILFLTNNGESLTKEILEISKKWESKLLENVGDMDDEKLTRLLYELAFSSIDL
jgi:DNA-binding MarR family transcriptional regulator